MAGGKKLHTLLWIPASGLFYDNGNFWDGDGQQVEYGRILPIWETYGAAEAAKARRSWPGFQKLKVIS